MSDELNDESSQVPPPYLGKPFWVAIGIVGLLLSPLLVGFEPIGADPDLLYRPIKWELSRALREGRLPFWSEPFGLGLPLLAESHIAALYPLNWIAYGLLDTSNAYSFQMWLHMVATAATTFAYARFLGVTPWGAALSGVSFALCGFQAAHACHEPFYMLMPYLPLCLLFGERYLASGRAGWLAGLAIAWAVQLTLGHFQIQLWTACLLAFTGFWRWCTGRTNWRCMALLGGGLFWGAAIVAVQLGLTWELTREAIFDREEKMLLNYVYPPEHLAQWALPEFYLTRNLNPIYDSIEPYWGPHNASAVESTAYIGVVGFILACVGLVTVLRHGIRGPLFLWCIVSVIGLLLATMPWWWLEGYRLVLRLPGLGWFRAPGRYILIPSLGAALLAGYGLNTSTGQGTFRMGLALTCLLLTAAIGWTCWYWRDPLFPDSLQPRVVSWRIGACAFVWLLSLAAIIGWRSGKLSAWSPVLVAALELGALYYSGPTFWGWRIAFPSTSPVYARLAQEQDVGLVAGRSVDLPVRVGMPVACPLLGISPPRPVNILAPTSFWNPNPGDIRDERWRRRFGVTHGIWGVEDKLFNAETILSGPDEVLGQILEHVREPKDRRVWKLVRYPKPFPPQLVAKKALMVLTRQSLLNNLANNEQEDEAWFIVDDLPPELVQASSTKVREVRMGADGEKIVDVNIGPLARSARVKEWDGRSGVVEHDGSCVLILRRNYYPGWTFRVNGQAEQPVLRVSAGIQGLILTGNGPSQIETSYRPTHLPVLVKVSFVSGSLAILVAAISVWRWHLGEKRLRAAFLNSAA